MQLEHSSIIYNHQHNPPMYIYTNPHNHNIHQISPMHKFNKSHIQLWHDSSTYSNACNVQDSSRCMWYQITSTKVVTSRCQHNILCKSTPPLTIHLCKSTPPFTFLIWLNMTMMHGHTSKGPIMQNLQHIYPPTTM